MVYYLLFRNINQSVLAVALCYFLFCVIAAALLLFLLLLDEWHQL